MLKKVQKCDTCSHINKCYSKKTSPRNVVINILACRIKMGINVNESTRLLLDMVKPSLIKLANGAVARVGSGYINMDDLIMDLESKIIESLLDEEHGYRIGELAYLTEYLFGTNPKTGWVRKWVLWYFQKQRRFYSRHTLFGTNPVSDTEQDIKETDRRSIASFETSIDFEKEHINHDLMESLINIIDDGITLNANEHRVISFCLAHANELNKTRLIDGVHIHLSEIMGVSRPRITRLFAVGKRKILEAAKERNISLI